MLQVIICDDEKTEAVYLRQLIKNWAEESKLAVETKDFNSAEALLFAYEDNKNADILLLDIQMKGENGIDLAKRLRHKNYKGQIIFITGFPDYAAEGYDVEALHYLMKPVNEEKFYNVLNIAVSRLQKEPRSIIFPKSGSSVKINADVIIYAEILSHTCTLHLTSGTEDFRMRIGDMEKLLGEGFFKCHRSYIVNMKYVRRVTKTAMILDNNREIPLSRGLYDSANQAFIRYN